MAKVSARGSLAEVRESKRDETSELLDGLAAAESDRDLVASDLHLAEELARVPWSMGGRQRQSLAALVVATLVTTRTGSTRLPLGGGSSGYLGRLIKDLGKSAKVKLSVLSALSDVRDMAERRSLDRIVGRPGEWMPLIADDGCIYLQRHHASEARLIAAIDSLTSAGKRVPPALVAEALADVCSRPSVRGGSAIELSSEQREAVAQAACAPLWVISGGPGTGKTSIIVALLRVLRRTGIDTSDIALAAPTGKAAQRMTESIASSLATIENRADVDIELAESPPAAKTLHRLLRYSPRTGRFGFHRNRPIAARVIVIDEASMIDLELMDAVVTAAGPETSIILLGDADQLPSVEAGAVLRELVLAGAAPPSPERDAFSTRLTTSYRMRETESGGSAILSAAGLVRLGETRSLLQPTSGFRVSTKASNLAMKGAELLDAPSTGRCERFARWWHERTAGSLADFNSFGGKVFELVDQRFSPSDSEVIDSLFGAFEKRRLLTALRHGPSGCESINRILHRDLIAQTTLSAEVAFYPGEPILIRQNDYQRDLFNGEHGVVLRVRDAGARQHNFRAVFRAVDGGFRAIPIETLRGALDLAYAITVHQSQGSEADEVGLILPTEDKPILSRELIYTAITRARRWALVSSSKAVLRSAVARGTERFSGIAAGLG